MCLYIYIYIFVYLYLHVHICTLYIHIYGDRQREREREREKERERERVGEREREGCVRACREFGTMVQVLLRLLRDWNLCALSSWMSSVERQRLYSCCILGLLGAIIRM